MCLRRGRVWPGPRLRGAEEAVCTFGGLGLARDRSRHPSTHPLRVEILEPFPAASKNHSQENSRLGMTYVPVDLAWPGLPSGFEVLLW